MEALTEFVLVKKGKQVLLDLQSSECFGLVARVQEVHKAGGLKAQVLTEFLGVFKSLDRIKDNTYTICLQEGSKPIALPACHIPHARHEPLCNELQWMEHQGIIQEVQEASDWVNPVVIV